ncbi:MAG TPA: cytochrome c oxidase assembly protein [Actinomycetota bacterium]|nr:cytochrome c oxidase assembly protein [Actinomycetota bacterium]
MVLPSVPPDARAATILTSWTLDPLAIVPIVAAAWVYAKGLRRGARAGTPHPRRSAVAFFVGLAVVTLALASPIDAYAEASFSIHMVQHLLLTLLAPPLLALGAPIALALRSTRPPTARLLSRLLRSVPAVVLSDPVVGWALFVGVAFVIHLTPLFDLALRSRGVHALEHVLWLATALLYWWPIVGRDPTAHPMGYPVRLLSLFLAMPAMSFLALAIYSARAPLYEGYASLPAPWGPSALADQRAGAITMWLVGNLALVVAMLVVATAWKRDEDARQHRLEVRAAGES